MAVENWGHDFNIGSVIRTANAFNAKAFHIVGRRRWNRRGAMVTDRYQHEHHHPTVEDLAGLGGDAAARTVARSRSSASTTCRARVPLETYDLPRDCVLVFGQEGPGLSDGDAGGLRRRAAHRAVRLDAVDQRRRGGGGCHACLGATPRLRQETGRVD